MSIALTPSQPYKNQETLLYSVNSTFNGLPIIKNDHPVRMYVDTDLIKNDKRLQGYIQLTDGDVSPIIGTEPLGTNNKWYIIYNKKTDEIYTGRDHMTDLIAGYIRLKKNNTGSDVIEQINSYMRDENSELLDHLTSGNLYYAEFNKEGNLDESAYLLPCEYVFKGTISKDIEEKESNYGVRKIDINLIGSELIDTKWFMDKTKFFSKQVK